MKGKKWTVPSAIRFAILSLIALVQLFPLYWLFTFSLKSNAEIYDSAHVLSLPQYWRFENYTNALLNGGILTYFMNSIIYTVVSVVASGILAAMAAYAIARMRWKLSNATYMVFTLGLMIPTQATLLPLFLLMDNLGLRYGYLGLLIPYTVFAIPMTVMILYGFYRSIPKDIEEAAYIDGCGIFRMFFRIILPIVKPAISTASIFAFLGTWNELLFANTLVDDQMFKPLTVGIMSFVGEHNTDWGIIGAGMVIATLPAILIYSVLSDKIQDSLIVGAVKG